MKITYIVALLMIVFMVGCATTQPEEAPAAPEEPAEETPALPEEPAEAPAEEAETPTVVEGDVIVTSAGFDPAEMTVPLGTMLTVVAGEGRHTLTVDGKSTPPIEEGTGYDITFDTAKTVRIWDLSSKKWLIVTVTEESAEEAEE